MPALILAPMAGVTDKPFRALARRLGAGYAVSEMTAADPSLRSTPKSVRRRDHDGETGPVGVQIAGADPAVLADAARFNVDHGAEIIDINMGCPAKKVCKAWAGSALLRDEALVQRILRSVVAAVDAPVTLKIRTGFDSTRINAVEIARIAEAEGIAAIAVHGRTRDMHYRGEAEYATIARVKQAVSIPVIANGDIDSAAKAKAVLDATGADALMIGRAAQGRPWIFREIAAFLETGCQLPEPGIDEIGAVLLEHVTALHALYGERTGVRVARKHLGWYAKGRPGHADFLATAYRAESAAAQLELTEAYFSRLATTARRAA